MKCGTVEMGTEMDENEDNRPLPGALPCPFCGGKEIATYAGSTFRWRYAACNGCGAQASEVRIETILLPRNQAIEVADRELLAAWNERAPRPEAVPNGWVITTEAGNAEYITFDGKRWRYLPQQQRTEDKP